MDKQTLRTYAQGPESGELRTCQFDELHAVFIQTVSHELRTPVSIIHGYAEILREGGLGQLAPEQRDAVARRAPSRPFAALCKGTDLNGATIADIAGASRAGGLAHRTARGWADEGRCSQEAGPCDGAKRPPRTISRARPCPSLRSSDLISFWTSVARVSSRIVLAIAARLLPTLSAICSCVRLHSSESRL